MIANLTTALDDSGATFTRSTAWPLFAIASASAVATILVVRSHADWLYVATMAWALIAIAVRNIASGRGVIARRVDCADGGGGSARTQSDRQHACGTDELKSTPLRRIKRVQTRPSFLITASRNFSCKNGFCSTIVSAAKRSPT